jgi:hypothetical protein
MKQSKKAEKVKQEAIKQVTESVDISLAEKLNVLRDVLGMKMEVDIHVKFTDYILGK